MSKQANYFKIGLFIVIGVGLVLAGIVILSTATLFEDTVTVETYFAESVQGLSEGSPVKFRGVQIGQVERIMFTYNKYSSGVPLAERKPYVLVEFSVAPEGLGGVQGESGARVLEQMVDKGLRVSLGYQGLTGLAYLELDLVSNPDQYPRLDIDWRTPKYYIPSRPSTIAQVSESMQSIMTTVRDIEQVPFAEIGQSVAQLLRQLETLEDDAELGRIRRQAIKLLEDSGHVVGKLRGILETEGVDDIPVDAAATVARARQLMETAGRDVPGVLEDLKKAASLLEDVAERTDKLLQDERIEASLNDASAAAEDLGEATDELPETATELRAALKNASRVIARQEGDIRALVRELQSISRNLNSLSQEVSRNPSRLLFGDPPPEWEDVEE